MPKYFVLIASILNTLRHKVYMQIRTYVRSHEGKMMDSDQLKALLKDVSLEGCREAVFDTYKISREKGKSVESAMKRAYYTYSIDKKFSDRVSKIY